MLSRTNDTSKLKIPYHEAVEILARYFWIISSISIHHSDMNRNEQN